jgi:hypothetical protein
MPSNKVKAALTKPSTSIVIKVSFKPILKVPGALMLVPN